MSLPPEADAYLRELRRALGSVDATERDDIVSEIRSHLLDRQAAGRTDLLSGFDPPDALAAGFVTESALRSALARGTPWALGHALLIATRDSVLRLLVLLPLILLQLAGVVFLVMAVLKPFVPNLVGLWVGGPGHPGMFALGIQTDHPDAQEVLGWWGIPLYVVAGALLVWGPNRAMRALARWRLRGRRADGGATAAAEEHRSAG